MIKHYNLRLLAFMCIVTTLGFVSSCEKKNDVEDDRVALHSFGPTGAMHGDTIKFIGRNLNKVTAVNFTGATVEQSAFIQQTYEVILVKVPQQAEMGYVTLKTPDGDIISKTRFNLNVPVSITSVTTEARPGANITIRGEFLNWVQSVTFTRNIVVDTFVSRSLTELVLKVPENAQTGTLMLSTGGTEPMEIITENNLVVTLPVATGISPNPIKHADNLTITGTNLDLAKGIIFTGVPAAVTSFVSQTPTQLVVKVPGGARQGKVTLVAASGVTTETTAQLTMILPAVTAITPNPVAQEGTVTITGSNLNLVNAIGFTGVANKVTTFVSQSPTQIVVNVPKGALKGKLTLSIVNSTVVVESTQVLDLLGGLAPLVDFAAAAAIYTDGLKNGFENWSYTDVKEFNSTANVRQGTMSVRGGYGTLDNTKLYQGLTFHHNDGISTTGYTMLEFSVFGEPGTGGKKLNMVINGNYTNPPQVTIVEGEWSTFQVPLSTLGNPNPLKELVLQSAGWYGVIHVDHVGLR
jgi:hypothetical protein